MPVDRFLGAGVLGLVVGVDAGLLGSRVSGLSQCRVAAFDLSGLRELDVFFITVSHAQWLIVIKKTSNLRRPLTPKAATGIDSDH